MRTMRQQSTFGATIFIAWKCFNRNVLRIHTSEFDENFKRTQLRYQGKFSQKLGTSHVMDPEIH